MMRRDAELHHQNAGLDAPRRSSLRLDVEALDQNAGLDAPRR
jgi:hypothetical protein